MFKLSLFELCSFSESSSYEPAFVRWRLHKSFPPALVSALCSLPSPSTSVALFHFQQSRNIFLGHNGIYCVFKLIEVKFGRKSQWSRWCVLEQMIGQGGWFWRCGGGGQWWCKQLNRQLKTCNMHACALWQDLRPVKKTKQNKKKKTHQRIQHVRKIKLK